MATSQQSEMHIESKMSVEDAVKKIVELDVEEEEDPLEGLNNA